MGNPKTENKGNKKSARILEAASELFLNKGYTDVTLREIAKKADVNLGLIPYYFTSKETLGKEVSLFMIEQLYQVVSVNESYLNNLPKAEQLYISTFLGYLYMEAIPGYSRFYIELISSTEIADVPSQTFIKKTWSVINEYGLEITEAENKIYLAILKGAERLLLVKRFREEITITYEGILDLVLSNYFFNIGLSKNTIAEIIQNSKTNIKKNTRKIPLNFLPYVK
jgi:AcrR family transcriptional regulator